MYLIRLGIKASLNKAAGLISIKACISFSNLLRWEHNIFALVQPNEQYKGSTEILQPVIGGALGGLSLLCCTTDQQNFLPIWQGTALCSTTYIICSAATLFKE